MNRRKFFGLMAAAPLAAVVRPDLTPVPEPEFVHRGYYGSYVASDSTNYLCGITQLSSCTALGSDVTPDMWNDDVDDFMGDD